MKISVILTDISGIGGCERAAVNIANEFCKTSDVSIVSIFYRKGKTAFKICNNVKLYIVEDDLKKRLRYSFINILTKFRKIIFDINPDIILFINSGTFFWGLSIIGYKGKIIGCEHTNLKNLFHTSSFFSRFNRFYGARNFDYIVTLTEADKVEYMRKYKISTVTNIYNCISDEVLTYEKKADIGLRNIISVGRFDIVKGYENLVECAKIVLPKHTDWKWYVYGDGDAIYKNKIRKLVNRYKLDNQLFICDATKNIYKKYLDSSILVLTSYYEGFPMVLLEGGTIGLPIVSFDCKTGPNEIVDNNINGYLIKCYDVNEMAIKIEELIDNIDLRKQFSNNTKNIVEKFNKEKICENWYNLFDCVFPVDSNTQK